MVEDVGLLLPAHRDRVLVAVAVHADLVAGGDDLLELLGEGLDRVARQEPGGRAGRSARTARAGAARRPRRRTCPARCRRASPPRRRSRASRRRRRRRRRTRTKISLAMRFLPLGSISGQASDPSCCAETWSGTGGGEQGEARCGPAPRAARAARRRPRRDRRRRRRRRRAAPDRRRPGSTGHDHAGASARRPRRRRPGGRCRRRWPASTTPRAPPRPGQQQVGVRAGIAGRTSTRTSRLGAGPAPGRCGSACPVRPSSTAAAGDPSGRP